MALENNYKLTTLYVLNVLNEYSDCNHLISQKEIEDKIFQLYGMKLDRKTIASSIDSLNELGYDIKKTQKGSYIINRTFEPSEIQFLVDAVFSSKAINSNSARKLAEKLSSGLSIYQRKQYNYIYKSDDVNRTDNKTLFYNIELINEAIENNKQLSFKYKRYNVLKGTIKDKVYVVNPYCLINNQGKYYLVCNYDRYNDIANYKVDKIYDINMLDKEIKPVEKLVGFENGFDIAKYANENIYMFGTKTVKATVKVLKDCASDYIDEWFGKNASFYVRDGYTYATLTTNENSLIYWCLQYGESVELISPTETVEKFKSTLQNIYKMYFKE